MRIFCVLWIGGYVYNDIKLYTTNFRVSILKILHVHNLIMMTVTGLQTYVYDCKGAV